MREPKAIRKDAAQPASDGFGPRTEFRKEMNHKGEQPMAIVKRPPESVSRSLSLEKPVSELLDDYCKFVDCSPDYVVNFALRKTLSRDPEHRKWKASKNGAAAGATEGAAKRPA
jgi:hypothetical protein